MKELNMKETENINGGYYTINSEPPCGTGGDPWLSHIGGRIASGIGSAVNGRMINGIIDGLGDLV